MKKFSAVFAVFTLVLLLNSCSSPIKYFGNSYTSTENVKIYFSKADVGQPYEVMGKIYVDIPSDTKDSKIQQMILDKAREHGADAIIMGDLRTVRTGSVSGGGGVSGRAGKKSGVNVGGGARKTKDTSNITMEIEVLKFKK